MRGLIQAEIDRVELALDDAGGEIYVMNDDGSNPPRLTPDLAIDQLLRWSR